MNERSELIEWIRGEIVGPSRHISEPNVMKFNSLEYIDPDPKRSGPAAWQPLADAQIEEVLYFDRETPHRKYGTGLLHPAVLSVSTLVTIDNLGVDLSADELDENGADSNDLLADDTDEGGLGGTSEDFEVVSSDVRHPSTIGISFCVDLNSTGNIVVRLPQSRRLPWQSEDSKPFQLNGRYEECIRRWIDEKNRNINAPMWRRCPAVIPNCEIIINGRELVNGKKISRSISMPEGSPMALLMEGFPRKLPTNDCSWLITLVLRNVTQPITRKETHESILYQTYFEVSVTNGGFEKYPENQRLFEEQEPEEKSLALLYRESATWAIGHGCSAGWDVQPNETPSIIYADVMPAVEIPSMTADIHDSNNQPIELSMRTLSRLSDDGQGPAWTSLENLATEYEVWINRKEHESSKLSEKFQPVAQEHLKACKACLYRINRGIELLRKNGEIRKAFRLTNLAMLLQQIATKQLLKRELVYTKPYVVPFGKNQSPWEIFSLNQEKYGLGSWRAFQIAFLLMSLEGVVDGRSHDREIVDLIWFPTGGGKTEAYLGVMAFYLYHQRLLITEGSSPARDGTNVLMRYTLRMLTTQQFQRAAALICAMEFLRRRPELHGIGKIAGRRFSLGLWIGGDGSPNKIADARVELERFCKGDVVGNPMILTECPWCRSEIGRYDGSRPTGTSHVVWNRSRLKGVHLSHRDGPLLLCPDNRCEFGQEDWQTWLPVEVIDERIYKNPPSLVIATADKFAMISYRPEAGELFGRRFINNQPQQINMPPGLIIQDELHLISGPLGTMYALYEGIFERLWSTRNGDKWIKPKLIASTATIRGADDQVKSLYNRSDARLFPSPGLLMGDSFFGTYAKSDDGKLKRGRLYLGIHANDYGSILTTQVRAFSSALFRSFSFDPARRDPWWSLLVFYNSIRELGGAKTLFDSDIRSRMKFMFNREGFKLEDRRNLRIVEELTSRLSQSEIVRMMDRLSTSFTEKNNASIDACLASNIIEVGVDIDRLSLMGVVGQPKTTAQYIQVTGRVGRRWWERPGLILVIYNPSKSRDRSHFEQFHSYHKRLYERVEPTSATPFAFSAIQRALPGALIAWARQHSNAPVYDYAAFQEAINESIEILKERCKDVQLPEDIDKSLHELGRIAENIANKWKKNPQEWQRYPPDINGEYLMLWPGQFATRIQKDRGVVVASSMRQVDGNAELNITEGYELENTQDNH